MTNCYRARATKAEQECAKLRLELGKKPKFKWLVDQIKTMLGFELDATANQVVQRIKVLRDNQTKYREGASARKAKSAELRAAFEAGVSAGRKSAYDEIADYAKTKAP